MFLCLRGKRKTKRKAICPRTKRKKEQRHINKPDLLRLLRHIHRHGVNHAAVHTIKLLNAFRQLAIIRAMGWPEPIYAHVPLIHGPDGAKLSKRHGALGVDAYRDVGYLP